MQTRAGRRIDLHGSEGTLLNKSHMKPCKDHLLLNAGGCFIDYGNNYLLLSSMNHFQPPDSIMIRPGLSAGQTAEEASLSIHDFIFLRFAVQLILEKGKKTYSFFLKTKNDNLKITA